MGGARGCPWPRKVISALKSLPSYQANEYVFPADQSNVRFKGKQAYAWDMRKPFQAACERAGVKGLRIHGLRHMATSILFLQGIPEAIIRKLTGHDTFSSRLLHAYFHTRISQLDRFSIPPIPYINFRTIAPFDAQRASASEFWPVNSRLEAFLDRAFPMPANSWLGPTSSWPNWPGRTTRPRPLYHRTGLTRPGRRKESWGVFPTPPTRAPQGGAVSSPGLSGKTTKLCEQ